jgi:low affinity Fe/Cu permease
MGMICVMANKTTKPKEVLLVKGLTEWVGSPASIVVHTLIFGAIFALRFLGVSFDSILLILTTAVSLEAIYLAIFIQMTVNRQAASLHEVEEDIEELGEEFEDISEDIEEDEKLDRETRASLGHIESTLQKVLEDIESMKIEKK